MVAANMTSRFNGFSQNCKPLKRLRTFSGWSAHRAKATVLMKRAAKRRALDASALLEWQEKSFQFKREDSSLVRSKKCPVINAKEVAVENRAEETYYHRTP
jgi:hypothetical protein